MYSKTHQVGKGVVHSHGAQRRAAIRPVRVARDVLEFQTRVELHGPLRRLEIMRRDRELGKREAPPRAPENDAASILRRPVDPGLQDAEAHLVPV